MRSFYAGEVKVTLLAHIMTVLDERNRRYEQRFEASQEALHTALMALEARLQGVNEFRATLSDQASTFATRDQVDALREAVSALTGRIERAEGSRAGISTGWAVLIGVVSVGALVVGLLTR